MDQWTPTVNPLKELSPPLRPQEYQSFLPNLELTIKESRSVCIHITTIFSNSSPQVRDSKQEPTGVGWNNNIVSGFRNQFVTLAQKIDSKEETFPFHFVC